MMTKKVIGLTRASSSSDLVAGVNESKAALLEIERKRLSGGLKNTAERRRLKRQQARLLTWLREQLAEESK